mgnify:CR=1 FL=1
MWIVSLIDRVVAGLDKSATTNCIVTSIYNLVAKYLGVATLLNMNYTHVLGCVTIKGFKNFPFRLC